MSWIKKKKSINICNLTIATATSDFNQKINEPISQQTSILKNRTNASKASLSDKRNTEVQNSFLTFITKSISSWCGVCFICVQNTNNDLKNEISSCPVHFDYVH